MAEVGFQSLHSTEIPATVPEGGFLCSAVQGTWMRGDQWGLRDGTKAACSPFLSLQGWLAKVSSDRRDSLIKTSLTLELQALLLHPRYILQQLQDWIGAWSPNAQR